MSALAEIEAIKALKYKYFRCLDCKLWDELSECLAPDATTSFTEGAYRLQGRNAIMEFLKAGLGRASYFGNHHGHHPEIELLSDTTAKGTWSARFYMIDTQENQGMHSAATYFDEYVKIDNQWKIKSTGYKRAFEERWNREDLPSLRLNKNMFVFSVEPK